MKRLISIFSKSNKQTKEDRLSFLFANYAEKLCSYGIHTWKLSEDDAWDLIYKTLYKITAVDEKYSFENKQQEQSFIFRTFINYTKNFLRDNKERLSQNSIELNEATFDINRFEREDVVENKKLVLLQEILDELEDWQKIVVLMRSDGRSYSEIAVFVDKPENQLKVYYQRIKEKISKKILEAYE